MELQYPISLFITSLTSTAIVGAVVLPRLSVCDFIRIIVDKMDKNKSGFVDKEELMEWIHHSTKRGIYDDTQKRWDYYDRDKSGDVHLDEWIKSSYSYMAGMCLVHKDTGVCAAEILSGTVSCVAAGHGVLCESIDICV